MYKSNGPRLSLRAQLVTFHLLVEPFILSQAHSLLTAWRHLGTQGRMILPKACESFTWEYHRPEKPNKDSKHTKIHRA